MQVYSPSKISQQLETFLNSVANGLGHTMSHAMSQTFSETVVAPVAKKAPKASFLAAAQAAMQAEDNVSKPKTVKKTKSSTDAAPKRVKKVKAPKEDTVVSKPEPVEEAGVDPAQQQEEQPPEEAGVEPKQPKQQQQQQQQEQPKEAEQEPEEQPEESVEPEQQQEPAEQEPAEQEPAEQEPAEQEPAEQEPAEQEPAEQQPAEQQPAEQQQEVEQPAAKPKKVKKTKTESEDNPKKVRKSSAKPKEETKISPIRVRQTKEFIISDSENEAPQKVQEPAKPKKVVRKPRVAPKAEGEDKPKKVRKSRAKLKPETEEAKKPKSKEFCTTDDSLDDYNKVKPSPAMIALMAVKEIPESENIPDKSDSEAEAPAPAIVKKRRTSLKKVESSDDEKLDEATGEQVIDEDALSKLTIQTLKGMCKTRNLKISGNKAALVQRLIEADGIAHIIPTTATVVQKVKKTKRLAVFSKVDSELKLIPCPGKEHMLMDEATGLVFLDEDPSTAVGFIEHGEVFGLDSEHITVCKNMGIRYSWTEDYLC
ncbi:orf58-like protein [Ranavirus ambystoma1]|uniref:Orf58-like protein n=1 Tax=Ranavirus ambystoma1 TaxID=265294 RepID=A0A482AAP5_9VIRU|nr:orf58-like protein [Ambystoma tigrinum virus]QBL14904.1 orf58-like protein [Ambystoma tigrinum virus]QBL15012.1 orf58-like protein [Ambystoma tigrinum virus]QBL15120.1 orf58-like protein [Ambystoma tigrinum virus]QBL15228.1 orf58-like protein [Ambystoma tigrinum virus]